MKRTKKLKITLPIDFYNWLQAEVNNKLLGISGYLSNDSVEKNIVGRLINCCKESMHRNQTTYQTVEEIQNGSKKTFEKFYSTTPIDRETECSFMNCHTGKCKSQGGVIRFDFK